MEKRRIEEGERENGKEISIFLVVVSAVSLADMNVRPFGNVANCQPIQTATKKPANSYNISSKEKERQRENCASWSFIRSYFRNEVKKTARIIFFSCSVKIFITMHQDCGVNWTSWNESFVRLLHHAVRNTECKLVRIVFFISMYSKFVVVH